MLENLVYSPHDQIFVLKVIESGSCGNSLQFLLDCDADISLENNVGRTPLHVASQCCNVEAALFLLFKGTPVNAKDKVSLDSLGVDTMIIACNTFLPDWKDSSSPCCYQ